MNHSTTPNDEIRNLEGKLFCKIVKQDGDIILESKTAQIPLQELLSLAYNPNERLKRKKK